MKKSLVALAALTALTATGAFAQATIWGVVDLNYSADSHTNASNTKVSRTFMGSDGISSSRLGFRADEDLGGGLKAGVWLEAGVNASGGTVGGSNSNAASAMFNRRATAQLSGSFGEVRLGRDYTPTFWNNTLYDAFGTNGVGSSATAGMVGLGAATALLSAGTTTPPSLHSDVTNGALVGTSYGNNAVRADNAINFFSPTMNGFKLQIMHALGGIKSTEGGAEAKSYTGARVSYDAGPLSAGVGFGSRGGDQTSAAGATPVVTVPKTEYQNFGASYDFGHVKAMGFVGSETLGGIEVSAWNIGAVAPMGAGRVMASYSKYDLTVTATAAATQVMKDLATTISEDDATKTAVGYVHDLSKNTSLYAMYAKVSNSGKQTLGVFGAGTSAAGSASTGYSFGMKTGF